MAEPNLPPLDGLGEFASSIENVDRTDLSASFNLDEVITKTLENAPDIVGATNEPSIPQTPAYDRRVTRQETLRKNPAAGSKRKSNFAFASTGYGQQGGFTKSLSSTIRSRSKRHRDEESLADSDGSFREEPTPEPRQGKPPAKKAKTTDAQSAPPFGLLDSTQNESGIPADEPIAGPSTVSQGKQQDIGSQAEGHNDNESESDNNSFNDDLEEPSLRKPGMGYGRRQAENDTLSESSTLAAVKIASDAMDRKVTSFARELSDIKERLSRIESDAQERRRSDDRRISRTSGQPSTSVSSTDLSNQQQQRASNAQSIVARPPPLVASDTGVAAIIALLQGKKA